MEEQPAQPTDPAAKPIAGASPGSGDPANLEPQRKAGRVWMLTKMGTFVATLVALFLDSPLFATLFLSASLDRW